MVNNRKTRNCNICGKATYGNYCRKHYEKGKYGSLCRSRITGKHMKKRRLSL